MCISVYVKVLFLYSAIFSFFPTPADPRRSMSASENSVYLVYVYLKSVCMDLLKKDKVQTAAEHCLVQLACILSHALLSLATERSVRLICSWMTRSWLCVLFLSADAQEFFKDDEYPCTRFSDQCRTARTSIRLAGSHQLTIRRTH